MTLYRQLIKLVICMIILCCGNQLSFAQKAISVSTDEKFPDFKIKIAEDIPFPDIKINMGHNISFADFSVQQTRHKNQAHFIISAAHFPDVRIQTGKNVNFPDLRIKIGNNIPFPDLKINIKTSGTSDYKIYTDKETLSDAELITALIPVIQQYLSSTNNNALQQIAERMQ